MPSRVLEFLARIANRQAIALLMVIFMILTIVVFPSVNSQLTAASGGLGMLDMQTGYSPAQAFERVAAYGEAGRALYLTTALTADTIYPLDYALLFALLLIVTYRRAFPRGRLLRLLVLAPFLTAGFDLLENLSVVGLLAEYPAQPVPLALIAGLFTTLKWAALVITVVLVLVCALGLVTRNSRRTGDKGKNLPQRH
jgi:hypothetical protein